MFQEGKCQDTSPCQDSADFMFTDVSLTKASHVVPDSTPGEPRVGSDSLGTLLIHVKHMLRDRQEKRSHWRKTHESLSERNSKTSRKQSFQKGRGNSAKCHRENKNGRNNKCSWTWSLLTFAVSRVESKNWITEGRDSEWVLRKCRQMVQTSFLRKSETKWRDGVASTGELPLKGE